MRNAKIAALDGDGIGPEVTAAAVEVLEKTDGMYGIVFNFTELPFGGTSIDLHGFSLTGEILSSCKGSDAVLLGAVGGPKWDNAQLHIVIGGYHHDHNF